MSYQQNPAEQNPTTTLAGQSFHQSSGKHTQHTSARNPQLPPPASKRQNKIFKALKSEATANPLSLLLKKLTVEGDQVA
jgi:hypothetical protein